MERITKAQEIYLNVIDAGGQWNGFDGSRIAADLRAQIRLWRSVVFMRLPTTLEGASVTTFGVA
jgi:hypothetical protein